MGKEQDLLEAARNGNVMTIEKLIGNKGRKSGGISALSLPSLRRTVNINFTDGNGDTALHLSALAGHRESVQLLLQHEAILNICDDKGCSPLHMAAWTGSAEVCQMILSQGSPLAVVNIQNSDGDTALHCASQYGHKNAVTALIEAEADPMIRNLKEESPLDLAAQYGRGDVVRLLMTRHPSLAFHVHQKHSPLHLASRYGHPAVVTLLLANGFEIGLKTSHGTALHEASCYCKEDVIRTLLKQGINVDETDLEGRTAVDILAALNTQKALDMMKFITEYSLEHGSQSSHSNNAQPIPISQTQPHSSQPSPHSSTSPKHSHNPPKHSSQQPHSTVLEDPQSLEPHSSPPHSEEADSSQHLPYTTPLTIQIDEVTGEPEYVSPEGQTVGPPSPIYAKPHKLRSKATPSGLDGPPLPPRNSQAPPGSPRSRELTVERGTRAASPSYMEMGQSTHPKISPGKPPRKRNPKSECSTDPPQNQTADAKPVSVISEMSGQDVCASLTESVVYEDMTRASDLLATKTADKPSDSLYGNLLEAAEATLSSIQTSLATNQENTDSETINKGGVNQSAVPETEETDLMGDNSEEVQLRKSSTTEASESRDSVGSGRGSRPPSLEFDNVRSRLLSQEMPLTPTGYSQPPTPDHPPPSPNTAVLGIHERINPMDKRKSRDIETLTEVSLLGGIPERDPEMEESELETEPQRVESGEGSRQLGCEGSNPGASAASLSSTSPSQTVTSNATTSTSNTTTTTTTTTEVSSTTTSITSVNQSIPVISVNTATDMTSDRDSAKENCHKINNSDVDSVQTMSCESQCAENTSDTTQTDLGESLHDIEPSGDSPTVGDSPVIDVNGVRSETVVNGVVLRRKSGTTSSSDGIERRGSEGSQDSINTLDGEPFSAVLVQHVFERLLKGSQPGGSRNVVSQICQNVLIRTPKSRHKRLSAPSAVVTFDPLMERDDEINAEKFMEAIDQAIAEGAATGETIPPVEEANFDDSEEWAKISAIVSSYGGRLSMANRDSVFFEKQMEQILSLAETGKALTVGDWLEGLGLAQYENTLIAHGFDDLDFLGGNILTVEDLKQIGIGNEEHRRSILEAAKLLLPVVPIGPPPLSLSVEEWLSSLHLSEYWHTFNSHGYSSMERVRKLWELELATVLDITNIGHRKRLLASLGERTIEKTEKLHVDITDWKVSEMNEIPKPQPSPIEGLDFYKDYTKVKPKPVDVKSEGEITPQNSRLQFDSSEDEDSLKRTGRGLRDSTIHIRPPHMAHTTSPVTQWRHRPEKLIKGCCNYVAQYLGSTLVKELNGIDSTREGMTKMKLVLVGGLKRELHDALVLSDPKGIRNLFSRPAFDSSAEGLAKIPVIMLSISYKGVKFIDAKTKRAVCEHEIGNIFCACQDPENLNFFAYITKDRETNKHYCHVFSVTRTDLAREIILTLGEAFEIAYQVALKEKAEEEAVDFERKLGQGSDAEDSASHSSKTSLNTI